jgi:hypothetical protein
MKYEKYVYKKRRYIRGSRKKGSKKIIAKIKGKKRWNNENFETRQRVLYIRWM